MVFITTGSEDGQPLGADISSVPVDQFPVASLTVPQTWWLKTTKMYWLAVLEAKV